MMSNINLARRLAFVAVLFAISACNPVPNTPIVSVATEPVVLPTSASKPETTQSLLKTKMEDFVILSARLVDEANGVKPKAGEKILLLTLSRPGVANLKPGELSLEDFSNMVHDNSVEIYILGKDGSRNISTMAGWVRDEFVMGFTVPVDAEPYTLYWTGNSPITLSLKE